MANQVMAESQPPSSYEFVALPDRGPLRFPGGARLALILTINLEYWEKSRPGQREPLFTGGPMTIPHALPGDVWDTANWTWREYGQRVGVWRLIDAFDRAGVKPSCTVNGLLMTERRRIVDAVNGRGWELVPHNWAQNDVLSYYADNPDGERAVIERTLDEYQRTVGHPAKAWLSSAIRGTAYTPAFLKEFGLIAYCDYLTTISPTSSTLCTVPSSASPTPTTSTTSTCSPAAGWRPPRAWKRSRPVSTSSTRKAPPAAAS
jgi:hypothetical protein